jgi:[ribosomal protein S5]-alanine N-acetyltransferase
MLTTEYSKNFCLTKRHWIGDWGLIRILQLFLSRNSILLLQKNAFQMIFETPRLIVRQLSLADADNFYTLNSDPDIVRFIRPPRTRAESDEKLKEAIEINNTNTNGLGGWVVETNGDQDFVGFFCLFTLPGSDEVHLGYSFLKHHWGFGFATEFTQAGVDYGFK